MRQKEKQMLQPDLDVLRMNPSHAIEHRRARKRTTWAICILLLASAGACHAQSRALIDDDLAKRASEIHWPTGFMPDKADLFAHNEIQINASCENVFNTIAEAEKWPSWYPNSKDVKVHGSHDSRLGKGKVFDWNTFGLAVQSRVHEFESPRRIGWFGHADRLEAYHTWFLTPKDGGCFVLTEEVAQGQGALDLRESDPAAMHKGHEVWNETLKATAEKR
jgi:uncharacterized protein YndB with AHSA1/START domain